MAAPAARPVTSALLQLHQDRSASGTARSREVSPAPARAPGWSSVDVTDLVRSWAAAGVRTGSVALHSTNEADPLSWRRLGVTGEHQGPRLTVTTP